MSFAFHTFRPNRQVFRLPCSTRHPAPDVGGLGRFFSLASMTQSLKLLHLAPDIQEQSLSLPRVAARKDPIHEKMLRPIADEVD